MRRSTADSTGDRRATRTVEHCGAREDEGGGTNRPKASNLRQQSLKAHRPLLTAKLVLPGTFLIGFICVALGILFLMTADAVKEYVIDYTDLSTAPNFNHSFTLKEHFDDDVHFFYGMENYNQNSRRYQTSRSDEQLRGDVKNLGPGTGGCVDPYRTRNGKPIAPCGAIANSMFNDTFELFRMGDKGEEKVPFSMKNLLWGADCTARFKNPKLKNGQTLCDAFEGTEKPINWQHRVCELGRDDPDAKSGFENVDFIIWMRTAAAPSWRNLHRRLDREASATFKNGLPKGEYRLAITNSYPVSTFGRKSFVIGTSSWLGNGNRFLGIGFVVTGSIILVLTAVLSIIHKQYGHSIKSMVDLSKSSIRRR